MGERGARERQLVLAAQGGDRQAREDLARAYLPLVYNVVARALADNPDVEDVVQESMLRMIRGLPELRHPERIRAWVLTIVVHQIGRYQQQTAANPRFDARLAVAQPQPDLEEETIQRLSLEAERRQVAQAANWLDQEDQTVLSLWWQEAAGQLSRVEVATALGSSVPYTGVRIKRMRTQLDRGRAIISALAAQPRCHGLDQILAGWDGQPGPLWRKRLDRHIRACQACCDQTRGQLDPQQLLVGCALLPVPAQLTSNVLTAMAQLPSPASSASSSGSSGGSSSGSSSGGTGGNGLLRVVMGRPVVAALTGLVATVALIIGVAYAGGFAAGANQKRPRPLSAGVSATANPETQSATSTATSTTSTTSVHPTASASQSSGRSTCGGAGLARIWASWPMPNPKGTGLPNQANYTNLGDGTVRDNVTCLVWQRSPAPATYTFPQANTYCSNLSLAGGGWHLPSRVELTSITDTTRDNPAINPTAFPSTPPRFFWTSSPWAVNKTPARAWIINFYEALASNAADQTGAYYVRCVRSVGAGAARPTYQIADGQVTDQNTGLIWQRAISPALTADAAEGYCTGLGLGGHTWRLPSIQELTTTVDETRVAPAIDPAAFPSTAKAAPYWSATRPSPNPSLRWALNYEDGYTTYQAASSGYARCVR